MNPGARAEKRGAPLGVGPVFRAVKFGNGAVQSGGTGPLGLDPG